MNIYKYVIFLNGHVVDLGTITATSEAKAEKRLKAEILPKRTVAGYTTYDNYHINQLCCESCGGGNDVIDFLVGDDYKVVCVDCRTACTVRGQSAESKRSNEIR